MKEEVVEFLDKLIVRFEIKVEKLLSAAQGETADLSAALVQNQIKELKVVSELIKEYQEQEKSVINKFLIDILVSKVLPMLKQEQKRVMDIVRIAKIEAHTIAVTNNNDCRINFYNLVDTLHNDGELVVNKVEIKDSQFKDSDKWKQNVIIANEKSMLWSMPHKFKDQNERDECLTAYYQKMNKISHIERDAI